MSILDKILGRNRAETTAAADPLPPYRPHTNKKERKRSGDGLARGVLRNIVGGNIIGASKMTRLEATWSTMPHTATAYIFQHWKTLVARSRQGCEDYDHLRKYVSLMQNNIPGANGFRLTSTPVENGKVDREAAKAIMAAFKEWSKAVNFDFEGRLSRAVCERLAVATAVKDGEAIGIIHTGPSAGPWGFSIEMADPMLLDPMYFETLPNGNEIRHSIEFLPGGGRPVAYHFHEQQELQMGYTVGTGRATRRVEAEKVIHFFVPEMVGQKRGMPWTRTALWRLRMLSGGEDAALANFRVTAGKMGFFRSGESTEDEIEADQLPMDAEPATFENIGDREFIPYDPQFPDAAIGPFIRAMLQSSAVGLLASYHNLSGDLTGVSYSSIRQGTLDEREIWLGFQGVFEDGWCLPIFEAWLKYSLLAGKILLPNGKKLPFTKFEKFKPAVFTGKRWQWIDPAAEANAAQIMIGQKLRSRSAVIRDIGEQEPEEVWDEIEAEDAALKSRKIVPLVPPGATPVLPPEADPSTGTDANNKGEKPGDKAKKE